MGSFANWMQEDMFGFKSKERPVIDPNLQKLPKRAEPEEYFGKHKDIFGFGKLSKLQPISKNNHAIQPAEAGVIIDTLSKRKLGALKPIEIWSDSIIWGHKNKNSNKDIAHGEYNEGAIELDLSPLGSWKAFVSVLSHNFEGELVWQCISAIPLIQFKPKSEDPDVENKIIDVIWENMEHLVKEKPLNPEKEYDLLPLVKMIDSWVQNEKPEWFIYEKTKRINNNRYITYFSVRGGGMMRPVDGERLEQFNIDMSFNPKTGLVKCIGQEISSPIRVHRWVPDIVSWDVHLSPSMHVKKMAHIIMHLLDSY
jgi:hypothetical protein